MEKISDAKICKLIFADVLANTPTSFVAGKILLGYSGNRLIDATKAHWDKVLKDYNKSGYAFAKLTEKVRIRRPYTPPSQVRIIHTNSH